MTNPDAPTQIIAVNGRQITFLGADGVTTRSLKALYRAYPRKLARQQGLKVIYRAKKEPRPEYVRTEIDDNWDAFWGPYRTNQ